MAAATEPHPRFWLAWVAYDLLVPDGLEKLENKSAFSTHIPTRLLDPIRQSEATLAGCFDAQRQAENELLQADEALALALQGKAEAVDTAVPRFRTHDPDGAAWNQAEQDLEGARTAVVSAQDAAVSFDQTAIAQTPELAALLMRRFGTEAYTGGPVARWSDARLARRIGFDGFLDRRKLLHAAIDQAEKALLLAEERCEEARHAAQSAWEAHGGTHVDPEAVSQASIAWATADAAQRAARARRMEAAHAVAAARRCLFQCVADFHRDGGSVLVKLATDLAWAHKSRPVRAPFDITPFLLSEGGRLDLHRDPMGRRACLALAEPSPWPDDQPPAWWWVAYAELTGIPGASAAQTAMAGRSLDAALLQSLEAADPEFSCAP